MIPEFVAVWDKHKSELEESFRQSHPRDYDDLVHRVVSLIHSHPEECGNRRPDPSVTQSLTFGSESGDRLYVLSRYGWDLRDGWYVVVQYGSCSSCDSLMSIDSSGCASQLPSQRQVSDYMTLALHVIQSIKTIEYTPV